MHCERLRGDSFRDFAGKSGEYGKGIREVVDCAELGVFELKGGEPPMNVDERR